MKTARLLPAVLLLAGLGGCDMLFPAGPEVCDEAVATLKSKDLPGALEAYQAAYEDYSEVECALNGYAYTLTLAGKYDKADKILAAGEPSAGEAVGDLKLRRALVALRAGNLDSVKEHGAASGLPAGQVLAAEVHMADAESDEAMALLKEAAGAGGEVGSTAQSYLDMLESDDSVQQGMAEVTALWALGQRESAVEAAGELVTLLPDDEAKAEHLMVWASRAVTSGHPDVARTLLDNVGFPPDGQGWRVQATRAMVLIAEGNSEEGLSIFNMLAAGGAPADGLSDALATAACITDDRAVAKTLAGSVESPGAARCLLEAGAGKAATDASPGGSLQTFLENR